MGNAMLTNINQKNQQKRKIKQENSPLTKSDILKKECPSAINFNATEVGLHSAVAVKKLIVCDNDTIIERKSHDEFEPNGNCLAYVNANRNELNFEYLNIVDTSNLTDATIGRSGDDYNMSPVHPCDGLVLNKNIRSVDSLTNTNNIVLIDKKDYDPYVCITLGNNDAVILMNFKKDQLCIKEESSTDINNSYGSAQNPHGCRKVEGLFNYNVHDTNNGEYLFGLRSVPKSTRPILKTVNGDKIEIINPSDCGDPIENKSINNQTHQNYMPFFLAPLAVAACLGIAYKRKAIGEWVKNINQKSNSPDTRNQYTEIEMTEQIN